VAGAHRLETTTVFAADDVEMEAPALVLGPRDHAYVSWAAFPHKECEAPVPIHEGTWFATDVDGEWAVKRLSKNIGAASLVVDVATGRLHATYNDKRGIRYVTRAADGTWAGSRIETSSNFSGSVLRRDPATGTLLLVGTLTRFDGSSDVYALTAS
jgi:hypothetical protein